MSSPPPAAASPPPAAASLLSRLGFVSPDWSALDPRRRVDASSYGASMPAHPAAELGRHLLAKGVERGAVVGLAATPLVALARGSPLGSTWRAAMLTSVAGGLAATAALTLFKAARGELDAAGVDDRAYRIAHSASQNAVDRAALLGGAAGAAAGAILGTRALRSVAAASFSGAALGLGACVARKEWEKLQAREKL